MQPKERFQPIALGAGTRYASCQSRRRLNRSLLSRRCAARRWLRHDEAFPLSDPASQAAIRRLLRASLQRAALQPQQLPDPAGRPVKQPVQHRLVERLALGRALHLNDKAVPIHRDVHVHVGA